MNNNAKPMVMPPCWRGHFEFDVPEKPVVTKPEESAEEKPQLPSAADNPSD